MFLASFWFAASRLLAAAVLLGCALIHAASPSFKVKSWSLENGLPHAYVSKLLQSRDGYLWVATRAGVARFDGKNLKLFTRATTAAFAGGDETLSIAADQVDNSIWFGTRRGVVHLKNGSSNLLMPKEGFGGYPSRIASSREGGVWAEAGASPWRITSDGKIVSWETLMPHYPLAPPQLNFIGGMCEDLEGNLWQANEAGVYVANLKTKTFRAIAPPGSAAGTSPHDIMQGADGSIYWLSLNRLARYQSNAVTVFTNSHSAELWGLAIDSNKTIWLGGNGLFRFLNGHFSPALPEIFGKHFVQDVTIDHQGHIWAGTRAAGFFRVKPEPFTLYTTNDGLLSNETFILKETRDGSVLIGADSGLNLFKNNTIEVIADSFRLAAYIGSRLDQLSYFTGDVRHIFEHEDGSIDFIASGHGYRFVGGQVHHAPAALFPNLCDNTNFWSSGRFIIRQSSSQITAWAAPTVLDDLKLKGTFDQYSKITEWRTNRIFGTDYLGGLRDGAGKIWFGSWAYGLLVFDGETVTSYDTKHGLGSNAALPLYEDAAGAIWISTEKGLSRWKNGIFRNIGVQQGLDYGAIVLMLDDGLGYYWFGGHRAVFRVPKRNLDAVADGKYPRLATQVTGPAAQGLHFPSGFRSKNGDLWFASPLGSLRFHPRRVPILRAMPTLIEEIAVDGNKLPPIPAEQGGISTPRLRLPPGSGKVIRIDFENCNFEDTLKIRFHSRLLGYSDKWVDSEPGEPAQFIGLPPGDFQFEVAAENPLGGWGEPATFRFRIAPHFYQTIPFYALSATSAVLLLGSLHWLRLRNSRRIYMLEHENAISKERERIAADMHDVLGSSLTKIGLQAELIDQRSALQRPGPEDLQKLRQTVRNAVSELDEVIWLFQSSEATLPALVEHLDSYAEDLLEPSGLRLFTKNFSDLPPLVIPAATRGSIVLIIREALNNAIKHSRASTVWLTTHIQGGELHFIVRDDGRGLDPALASGRPRYGFSNMRNRVEALGGKLLIDQLDATGTRLTAAVPLRKLQGPGS